MQEFIKRHENNIRGVLTGFDRMRFRGTLRWLANTKGMLSFLWNVQVLLKNFKAYALAVTDEIRRSGEQIAADAGRPVHYVPSSIPSKERIARRIAEEDGVTTGLIAVLTCVEPCWSYEVGGNRAKRELELRGKRGKCLHQYFYFQDPQWGFMHARLQTWFPFNMHVCINGRDWLAQQMDHAGIGYKQRDNCFVDVEHLSQAQHLLNTQVEANWEQLLTGLVRRVHPVHERRFARTPIPYYWSLEESEWATDVMFRSPAPLSALYPRLIRHGIQTLSSADVLRFLGRKTPAHGGVNGHFQGEVLTDLKTRPEGLRIKHSVNHNSIKMYDKQGSVLRIETTINNTRDYKVRRCPEGARQGKRAWRRLRKGVVDIPRRAEISQASNDRYLQSLAAVDTDASLGELTDKLCRRTTWNGYRVRALNPWSPDDVKLLQAIQHGKFLLNGFRNRDLRALLHGPAANPVEQRRQAAAVTRQIRMLRAHGLIRKVSTTHRYLLTARGTKTVSALLNARQANATKLTQLAG